MEISEKWGLFLNCKKSAIVHFRPTQKGHIRATLAPFIESGELVIKVKERTLKVPIKENYTYLGIEINQNLSIKDHIKKLRKKIQYLTFSLYPIRRTKCEVKFLQNLWQITARSLLDYAQTFNAYTRESEKKILETLYRTSIRNYLGLKKGTSKVIVDKIIKLDYQKLHQEYKNYYLKKWEAYKNKDDKNPIFKQNINRVIIKIDLEGLERNFISALNVLGTRQKCCVCHGSPRINQNHYNYHFANRANQSMESIIESTFQIAEQLSNIKEEIKRIRANSNDEKHWQTIKLLKSEKRQLEQETKDYWNNVHNNLRTLLM